MQAAAAPAPVARSHPQRGAILLLVLILTVALGLLGITLAAATEVSLRVHGGGTAVERAERAAASGVEWAAAAAMTNGLVDATRTLALDGGARTTVTVEALGSPQVVSKGWCNGAEVTLTADLTLLPGATLPFAWASFDTQSTFDHALSVDGTAYFGGTPRPIGNGSGVLQMNGDLHLVTTTTLANGLVVHAQGITRYGVARIDPPATNPAAVAGVGGVPVTQYTGTTQIRDQTLTGLVVVTLDLGEYLEIGDSVINGALVVRRGLLTSILPLLEPQIRIVGATVINGGTNRTGNLAIMAPDIDLEANGGNGSLIAGVTIVRQGLDLRGLTFRGQLLTLRGIQSTSGINRIERPVDFRPDVPVGVQWSGAASVRIEWRDRL